MSCVLVIDSNIIAEGVSYYYSSQQSSYPASNALDLNRRRRTWRSAGYWNIANGSNTLVIRDAAGGADLTATVTAAAYASDALFFAALKTALEAASDSTFTISRDVTTNAIKITAVLGGAASAFQIRGAAAGSAALAATMGYALVNTSGALFYVADLVRLHTEEFFIFDFGFPVNPNAVLGLADRNIPLRIQGTATIRLQGNLTNDFSAPALDLAAEVADFAIGLADSAGFGSYRYWKLKIQDLDNPYGYVELGALILGTATQFTRGAADFPMAADDADLSILAYSEGGQLVTAKRAQTQVISLNWNGLDAQSAENLMGVFETYGTHSPFAVVLDGNNAFSTNDLFWSKMVRMTAAPRKQLVSPGNWSVTWQLREDL